MRCTWFKIQIICVAAARADEQRHHVAASAAALAAALLPIRWIHCLCRWIHRSMNPPLLASCCRSIRRPCRFSIGGSGLIGMGGGFIGMSAPTAAAADSATVAAFHQQWRLIHRQRWINRQKRCCQNGSSAEAMTWCLCRWIIRACRRKTYDLNFKSRAKHMI